MCGKVGRLTGVWVLVLLTSQIAQAKWWTWPFSKHHVSDTEEAVQMSEDTGMYRPKLHDCSEGKCRHSWFRDCTESGCGGDFGWYAVGDFIYLRRERPSETFLGREVDLTVLPVQQLRELTTDSDRFNYEPGFHVLIGLPIKPEWSVEASFFGIWDWSQDATLVNRNPPLFGMDSPYLTINGGAVDAIGYNYETELRNFEANFRNFRPFGPFTTFSWFFGARYIWLSDEITVFGTENLFLSAERSRADVDNHLIGGHVGASMAVSPFYCLSMGLYSKVGVYGNMIRNRVSNFLRDPGSFPAETQRMFISRDDGSTGVSLEAGAKVAWRITNHISIRGGYSVLFLDGLALAPDQLNANRQVFATTVLLDRTNVYGRQTGRTDETGSMLIHGFSVGLEIDW
ncbi:MAG: BBP7 family outer membrane beta-barrel protein [Gemmatales bacterium]|nr:BBP7 family outer membrane beta-barrel protein [Gemmatales bacterium]MCS7159666.1 BBP7 family outer membrane beta-barrel protein [Gemmatales bacterium]MDW8174864.1 BBP7 family outer membrane beta-barrel protein [Gemmatales bacterium]MDW8221571.1 BBP7 family outer membrane beta-barrel protein [Gemmatales bacterium]